MSKETSYKNVMDFVYKFQKSSLEEKDNMSNEIHIIFNGSNHINFNTFIEDIIETLELSYKQIFVLKSVGLYVASYIIDELGER